MAGQCSRFPLAISRLVVARSTPLKRSATATLTHVPPVQVPKPPVDRLGGSMTDHDVAVVVRFLEDVARMDRDHF
jgi:hypothetical protein